VHGDLMGAMSGFAVRCMSSYRLVACSTVDVSESGRVALTLTLTLTLTLALTLTLTV